MTSSFLDFISTVNQNMGIASFCIFLVMLLGEKFNFSYGWQSLLSYMVIFDVMAFCITSIGLMAADNLTGCGPTVFWLVGDIIWALKDACKYAFIASRCETMYFRENKWISKCIFIISLSLYTLYIIVSYNLSNNCEKKIESNAHINFNWSLLILYCFWLIVSFGVAALISLRFNNVTRYSNNQNPNSNLINKAIYVEEVRLLIVCILMVIVTINSIVIVVWRLELPNLGSIVFVFTQLVIVMNEFKLSRPDDSSMMELEILRAKANSSSVVSPSTFSKTDATISELANLSLNFGSLQVPNNSPAESLDNPSKLQHKNQ
ncbi:hypothetical protein BC833DRAFT_590027 [Globomyces pollinis-pini]|nr:hypothetical protein BC833DRAFT_590027 [Globomyces pollinis-pini]